MAGKTGYGQMFRTWLRAGRSRVGYEGCVLDTGDGLGNVGVYAEEFMVDRAACQWTSEEK